MSIRHNGKVIAGATQYHPDLFDWKWADHQLDDVQWLRADTFSWQSGAVYESAYQHLVDDIDGQTAQTETVAGITISFYLANDGHKITTDESAVAQIYAATGIAWYYVLDTTNQRFKLPRAKHNKYAASLNVFGNGNPLVMTDGTDTLYLMRNYMGVNEYRNTVQITTDGLVIGESKSISQAHIQKGIGVSTDPSKSGLQVVQTQDTDQYKYLYFYIGSFTQTAVENTAGLNAELFNGKADLNLANVLANIDFVVERQEPTAANNYTWYRKYRSGWVEQGGQKTFSSNTDSTTQNLPIAMANTDYQVVLTKGINTGFGNAVYDPHVRTRGTTSFTYAYNTDYSGSYCFWVVYGIAA